jgi:very-short-patch-repair endonuclease
MKKRVPYFSDGVRRKISESQKEQRQRDMARNKEIAESGLKMIRFWENEIKVMTIKDLRNKLNNFQIPC